MLRARSLPGRGTPVKSETSLPSGPRSNTSNAQRNQKVEEESSTPVKAFEDPSAKTHNLYLDIRTNRIGLGFMDPISEEVRMGMGFLRFEKSRCGDAESVEFLCES